MHDDPAALALLDTALRGAAASLLMLLAVAMVRGPVRQPLGRISAGLAGGLALQLLATAPAFAARAPAWLEAPLVAVAIGNAVSFWWFVRALADARFTPRRRDLASWFVVALASLVHCVLARHGGAAAAAMSGRALQLVAPACAALALRTLLRRRRDVDDATRALGGLLVVGGTGYVLARQGLRLLSARDDLGAAGAPIDAALLLVLVALVARRLLALDGGSPWRVERNVLSPVPTVATVAPPPAPDDRDPADERLEHALEHLMREHQAWREPGLELASLAARLDAPEYRLRRVIVRRLGHRSVTAYVNGLRLADARAVLADPARRDLPVLTIALDAGFRSIGPFNRAFKAASGRTPTEFRREKLAES